jgi:hypothetical protein
VPESMEEKANRLLVDGRICVRRAEPQGLVVATAEGDTGTYDLGFDPERRQWRCTCPARKPRCSHLMALQLVVEARS